MTKLTDKQIRWTCKHMVDVGDYDKFRLPKELFLGNAND